VSREARTTTLRDSPQTSPNTHRFPKHTCIYDQRYPCRHVPCFLRYFIYLHYHVHTLYITSMKKKEKHKIFRNSVLWQLPGVFHSLILIALAIGVGTIVHCATHCETHGYSVNTHNFAVYSCRKNDAHLFIAFCEVTQYIETVNFLFYFVIIIL